jgi:fluoride exporter
MDASRREIGDTAQPVGPRGQLRDRARRRIQRRRQLSILAVIACGGVSGSGARYGIGVAFPRGQDGWPWATLLINITGCLLIGVLMVLIVDVWVAHRLVRPFLGVGVLGGYTTFSAYTIEALQLIEAGRPAVAVAYLVVTVVAALTAVQLGVSLTRALAVRSRKKRGGS